MASQVRLVPAYPPQGQAPMDWRTWQVARALSDTYRQRRGLLTGIPDAVPDRWSSPQAWCPVVRKQLHDPTGSDAVLTAMLRGRCTRQVTAVREQYRVQPWRTVNHLAHLVVAATSAAAAGIHPVGGGGQGRGEEEEGGGVVSTEPVHIPDAAEQAWCLGVRSALEETLATHHPVAARFAAAPADEASDADMPALVSDDDTATRSPASASSTTSSGRHDERYVPPRLRQTVPMDDADDQRDPCYVPDEDMQDEADASDDLVDDDTLWEEQAWARWERQRLIEDCNVDQSNSA